MICYNCGLKIKDTKIKECQFCGVKFGQVCSLCKSPNPVMSNFCFSCGSSITLLQDKKEIKNNISLKEFRKNVAVIFADISGFTALSEKLDPEIVREIINECFSYITTPVYKLGGTIDKYIGDCIMILFGAKNSHADDAKRAVLCAMEMQKLIKNFSDERLSQYDFSIKISIGIHYGLVVTGGIGNYYDVDYTVMGDTVNTAQRIQSNTPSSLIYVSQSVYKETYEDIEYSNPISFMVKNRNASVTCYVPKKIIKSDDNFANNIPFFGRNTELHFLNSLIDKTRDGFCQFVNIIGSAGIGKTRLIHEFVDTLNDKYKFTPIECNPKNISKPYALIVDLLMQIMNISQDDPPLVKQSRIISYVSYIISAENEWQIKRNYQFIGLLLGLEMDNELKDILNAMDTDSIFNELVKQLCIFFNAYAQVFKSIILLEDLHWCDSKSSSVLQLLISKTILSKGQLVFVCTSRNSIDYLDNIAKDEKNKILLQPLSTSSTKNICSSYIGCNDIDDGLLSYIEKYSDNNPLYIIELLKYLKRNSVYYIKNEIACINKNVVEIPTSIQGLILSKLNDFPESSIELIQLASVVGKDFSISVLKNILGNSVETSDLILSPAKNNIFSLKSTHAYSGRLEKTFSFNHETEREVIYESILNKQKKLFHKKIGEAIEKIFYKSLDNYYELLGEHFEKAENYTKAPDYYFKSAIKHKKLFNSVEALSGFHKSLELLEKNKNIDLYRLYDIYKELGEIYSMTSEYQKAITYLNLAIDTSYDINSRNYIMLIKARILQEQGSSKEAMSILTELHNTISTTNRLYGTLLCYKCTILRVIGEQEEALKLIKQAEKILKDNSDYESLTKALNIAGTIYYSMGSHDLAIDFYTRAYLNAEKIRDLQTIMKTSTNMAIIHHTQGNISKAMEYFNIALEMAQKISHKRGYITTCNNLGILYMDKGMFVKAKELFEEAVKNAQDTSVLLYESSSLSNLADIENYFGNLDLSNNYAIRAMTISVKINDIEGEAINYITLAKNYIEKGIFKDAQVYLERAKSIYGNLDNEYGLCDYYYYSAQLNLSTDMYEAAVTEIEKSLDYAKKYKSDKKIARALRLLGITLQNTDKIETSIELLTEAIILFEKEDALYEIAKCLYYRGISYKKIGNIDKSTMDLFSARKKITSIDNCKWTSKIEHGVI